MRVPRRPRPSFEPMSMIQHPSSPAGPILLPEHRADLERSGLTDATIAEAGLRSVESADETKALLCWPRIRRVGVCLAFPYFDAEGRPLRFVGADQQERDYVRLKP